MNDAIWTILVTILAGGFGSLSGAIALGKLVPVSRVIKAEADGDKWRQSYEQADLARAELSDVVKTQQLRASITNDVLNAVKAANQGVS